MARVWLALLGLLLLVIAVAWLNDRVAWQGEHTVYTADCAGGAWQDARCTGRLVAGPRYRFRALKAHAEVLFWTVGSAQPSGKFVDCRIADGRNWSCPPNADAVRTIAHELAGGQAQRDAAVALRDFHQVPKWKWLLLRAGVPVGRSASG